MDDFDITNIANHCAVQRLLTRYFFAQPRYTTFLIEGATLIVEPSRHRTGLPAEAIPSRYVITHVAEGWSVIVRTVWRDGLLLQPAATHTRIDYYLDDEGRYGNEAAGVAVAFNAWLKSLDL